MGNFFNQSEAGIWSCDSILVSDWTNMGTRMHLSGIYVFTDQNLTNHDHVSHVVWGSKFGSDYLSSKNNSKFRNIEKKKFPVQCKCRDL